MDVLSNASSGNNTEDENDIKQRGNLMSDNEDAPLINGKQVYIYKRRWFILFIFAMNTIMSGMLFMPLSGINNIASRYYNVSTVSLELLTNMMNLGFIIFALPASYLISRWGVRPLLITAACLHTTTTILHYVAHDTNKFWLVVVGQTFSAIGCSAILQVPAKLSALWFPERERATATSISVVANIFGSAIGFIHPSLMVRMSSEKNIIDNDMKMFYLSRLIIAMAILVLTFAYKEMPPTPPSAGSTRKVVSFCRSLKLLWSSKSFIFLGQSFGIYFGLYSAISPLVDPLVTSRYPSGYESTFGWMGFTNSIAAIFAFILIGRLLDRYHKYQITSILLILFSLIIWLALFVVLMNTDIFALLFVLYVLFGMCSVPMISASIEQAAQMTYPVSEQISTAILMIQSNIYAIMFIYILSFAIQSGYVRVAGYTIGSLYLIAALMVPLAPTDLNRFNAESDVT